MAKAETEILKKIMLALSPLGVILWRNSRGMFLTLDGKRKVHAGLQAPGSSDLIGFRRVKITQEMVGRVIPCMVAIEVKTLIPKTYPSHEQQDFVDFVLEAGGYAGVARSVDDAVKIINKTTK